MRRTWSPRTQAIVLLVAGIAGLVGGVLLELFDHRMDSFMAWRTPVLIAVGIVAIVVGVARLRRASR